MTYIAKHRIDAGEKVYEVGRKVPEAIVDEAMVEAGSVELVAGKADEAPAEVGLQAKTNRELYALCAERSIATSRGLSKDKLVALLESADAKDEE